MKIIVAGSRGFNDYNLLRKKLDFFLSKKDPATITIISGGARGADQLGERYARERGLQLEIYPAEWEKYGKSAGYKRNELMAEKADGLVAFWDLESRGTKHMIDLAGKKGLLVKVVAVKGE